MREDWVEVEIGEIANIYNGNSINARLKEEKYKVCKTGLNYIGTKDVNFDGLIEYENGVKIPFDEPKFRIAPRGSVLVCSEGGSAGRKTAFVYEDICFGNKLYAVTNEYSVFEGKYVFYYTRYRKFFEDFKSQMNGIIGGVSATKFSSINFPLAPLPIQRTIVSKVESLITKLDRSIADLKKAQEQLKIYHQAVLKKAFEEDWQKLPLKECCVKIQDGSHFSPKVQETVRGPEMFPYITSKNIRNNYMDLSSMKYVTKEFHESIYNRCDPKIGDVLLTKDGVNTGNVTLNIIEEPFSLLSSVCLIRPNLDKLLPSFVKFYIQSPNGFTELTGKMTGTAIKRIILKRIKEASIPVPPIEDQANIIKHIDAKLSVCDKVEQSITEALEKSEALRQSILKKAFEGKLLREAEITKCKQEADYEPASVLLKKIKADKK